MSESVSYRESGIYHTLPGRFLHCKVDSELQVLHRSVPPPPATPFSDFFLVRFVPLIGQVSGTPTWYGLRNLVVAPPDPPT